MSKIENIRIDLSGVSGYVDGEYDELIQRSLSDSDLFRESDLYSVFNYAKLERLLESGTTRNPGDNIIYALSRDQLKWDNGEPNCLSVCVLQEEDSPGIAVLDGKFLKSAYGAGSEFGYEFLYRKDRAGALRGVVELIL